LKFTTLIEINIKRIVAVFMTAWIEIEYWEITVYTSTVAVFMTVWIEMRTS